MWQNCQINFLEDEILDFIENGVKLLLRSARPFLVLAGEDFSPVMFRIDKGDIWIAFLSEPEDNLTCPSREYLYRVPERMVN